MMLDLTTGLALGQVIADSSRQIEEPIRHSRSSEGACGNLCNAISTPRVIGTARISDTPEPEKKSWLNIFFNERKA